MAITSTPSLSEFNPNSVPYQYRVIEDVRSNFDYDAGAHEVLLSGSVGSAKSILMAHLAVTHCMRNPGARICLGRLSMPDLKSTIYQKILEHIEPCMKEGIDYQKRDNIAEIDFRNGSEVISRSWSDKRFKKFRSLELSAVIIEELTENNDMQKEAYDELRNRIGRLPHIKENFMISATNPDAPSHWAYKYFILSKNPMRHVYYSVTTDNPFLPPQYIDKLKNDMDPREARRMIYGEWLEIAKDVIYHAYTRDKNYSDTTYTVDPRHPIHISWDFNIGEGKPLSLCCFQFINDHFHVFNQVVVEGARTLDSCEELAMRGLLDYRTLYRLHGDATGGRRDTRSIHSDYDIIRKFFGNYRTREDRPIRFRVEVPKANPPIRSRHNKVNAYCKNANGKIRVTVYKEADTVDEALRLTALKKGGSYIEDDSKSYQHIGTAFGYGLWSCTGQTGSEVTLLPR